jgi:inner membrane protein
MNLIFCNTFKSISYITSDIHLLINGVISLMGKTHVGGGILFGIIAHQLFFMDYFYNLSLIYKLLYLVVFYYCLKLGSLLPDIDTEKSTLGLLIPTISRNIHKNYGHRTITHSIFFITLVGLLLFIIKQKILILFHLQLLINIYPAIQWGILLGCASHIFFDMLNMSGVALLYPRLDKIKFPIPKIKTNSPQEELFRNFIYILIFLSLIYYIYSLLQNIIA